MPFGAGHLPLILLLLLATVIIFGPGKLPELGAGMGRAIREFKQHTGDLRESMSASMSAPPAGVPAPAAVPAPVAVPTDVQHPAA